MALAAGLLGTTALAAQNVGLQAAPLAFMVALGVSVAANVRVGNLLGAGRADDARHAAAVALAVGGCIAVVLAAALLLLRNSISKVFSTDSAVIELASAILPHVALFICCYFPQAVGQGIVRGCGEQARGASLVLLGSWLVGVPAAFFLALGPWRLGLAGLWGGQSLGYFVIDAGFVVLLVRIDWTHIAQNARQVGAAAEDAAPVSRDSTAVVEA